MIEDMKIRKPWIKSHKLNTLALFVDRNLTQVERPFPYNGRRENPPVCSKHLPNLNRLRPENHYNPFKKIFKFWQFGNLSHILSEVEHKILTNWSVFASD